MTTRRERVVVEAVDNYTGTLGKMAAETRAFRRELDGGRSSRTSFRSDIRAMESDSRQLGSEMNNLSGRVRTLGIDSNRAGPEIDRLSGRIGLLLRGIAVAGPALVPLAAAAVPALAAVTAGIGALGGAVGVTALALSGIGDGLKALNDYQLEPTAANAAKVREEFARIGPDGERFVRYLDSIGPQLKTLQDTAREGALPGFAEGIDAALERLPEARSIIGDLSTAMGDIATDAGEGLAGPGFDAFFEYLDTRGAPILRDLAEAGGNVIETFANLLVGVDPATDAFLTGLVDKTGELVTWSQNLDDSEGFQNFLDYAIESGPKALDFLGSLTTTLAAIATAAAPVGDVVLPILTGISDATGAIAESDAGPVIFSTIAALSALSLATRVWGATSTMAARQFVSGQMAAQTAVGRTQGRVGGLGKSLGVLAAVGGAGLASSTGVADDFGWTSAAALALTGAMIGGVPGAIGGGLAGAMLDVSQASLDTEAGMKRVADAAKLGAAGIDEQREAIDAAGTAMEDLNNPELLEVYSDPAKFEAYFKAGYDGLERIRDGILSLDTSKFDVGDFIRDLPIATPEDAAQLERANEAYNALRFTLSGLASQTGTQLRIGADGQVMADDLESAARRAQPALDELGITLDDLAAMPPARQSLVQDWIGDFVRAQDEAAELEERIRSVQEVLSGRANMRGFEQAIDDATDALAQNGRTLNLNTQAGRDNQAALDGIADSALRVAQDLGPLKAPQFLKGARRDFIDTAVAMGMTRPAARRLANELDLVARKRPNPKVGLDDDASPDLKAIDIKMRALDATTARPGVRVNDGGIFGFVDRAKAAIRSLDGDTAVTYIKVQRIGGAPIRADIPAYPGAPTADGGTVPKSGRAYADRYQYLLADGEEVVSNRHGQADRHRGLLKAINAGVDVRHFYPGVAMAANGATVGRSAQALAAQAPRMASGVTVVHNHYGAQGPMEIRGTLDTGFGPGDVAAIAESVVDGVNEADRDFSRRHGGGR